MTTNVILEVLEEQGHQPGAMLPVLHEIQARVGCIPDDAIPLVARHLGVSQAEVHGVVSFYHDFRRRPAGRHVLRLCQAEACQAVGAEALAEEVKRSLGCDFHETSADGAVTLEPVYCLGLCASGPSALVDDTPHARLTAARAQRLLTSLQGTP